jgi:hypothetical protein
MMKTEQESLPAVRNLWKFKGWIVCGTALVSFAAGSLLTARLTHLNQVKADSNRVFELMVYHTCPAKCRLSNPSFVTFQSYKPNTPLTSSATGYPTMILLGPTPSSIWWLIPARKKPKRIGLRFMPTRPFRSTGNKPPR